MQIEEEAAHDGAASFILDALAPAKRSEG